MQENVKTPSNKFAEKTLFELQAEIRQANKRAYLRKLKLRKK